jgi:hypothetical protein
VAATKEADGTGVPHEEVDDDDDEWIIPTHLPQRDVDLLVERSKKWIRDAKEMKDLED